MDTFPLQALKRLLESRGYAVSQRETGWHECLVSCEEERWHGHGPDPDAAFHDAARSLAPSRVAWQMLVEASQEFHDVSQAPDVSQTEEEPSDVPIAVPAEVAKAEQEPSHQENGKPKESSSKRPSDEELEELLNALAFEFDSAEESFGFLSPERLFLSMQALVCRFKHAQALALGNREMMQRFNEMYPRLARMNGLFWPGSINVMKLESMPCDITAPNGFKNAYPRDWGAAAELAAEYLNANLDRRELDEDGWRDAHALWPAPVKAKAQFEECCNIIGNICGNLEEKPSRQDEQKLRKNPKDFTRLIDEAKRLRWLRGFVDDASLWGRAMGRLRWASELIKVPLDVVKSQEALQEVIHGDYVPPEGNWAMHLGQDPRRRRTQNQRASLLQNVPRRYHTDDEWRQWLELAFGIADSISREELKEVLAHARQRVFGLDPAELFPDKKNCRQLLKKLQLYWGPGADVEEDEDEAELEQAPLAIPSVDEPESQEDYLARLAEDLRPHTEGKRALCVSNREDPELKEVLEGLLGQHLKWSTDDVRRVQSQCSSIKRGTYDMVYCITGFTSHKISADLLGRTCKGAHTDFVSVRKGRPQRFLIMLRKYLGLPDIDEVEV